eukprot:451510_1
MYFIYNGKNCVLICYNILENNYTNIQTKIYPEFKYITQLHFQCNTNSLMSNNLMLRYNQSSERNYSTPSYIYFVYNHEHRVGDDLMFTFYVGDQFGSTVYDYQSPVSILFVNKKLGINHTFIVNISNTISIPSTDIIVSNDDAYALTNEMFTIDATADDDALKVADKIQIRVIAKTWPRKTDWKLLYLLFLLLIPLGIIIIICIYCRVQYMKAFVIDKAVVFIIGISQFDDKKSFLPGVQKDVKQLQTLWKEVYKYDVFTCNPDTLYCTKQDIIEFFDKHKQQLTNTKYKCCIFHLISHGNENDSFTTSDMKQMEIEFFIHETWSSLEDGGNHELIKILLTHCCRGGNNYSLGSNRTTDNYMPNQSTQLKQVHTDSYNIVPSQDIELTELTRLKIDEDNEQKHDENSDSDLETKSRSIESKDANWIIVYGTIKGRTVSDSGYLAHCVSASFTKNAKRRKKKDLHSLIVEIGRDLEYKTEGVEVCNYGTNSLRHDTVRLEISKGVSEQQNEISISENEENMPLKANENISSNIVCNVGSKTLVLSLLYQIYEKKRKLSENVHPQFISLYWNSNCDANLYPFNTFEFNTPKSKTYLQDCVLYCQYDLVNEINVEEKENQLETLKQELYQLKQNLGVQNIYQIYSNGNLVECKEKVFHKWRELQWKIHFGYFSENYSKTMNEQEFKLFYPIDSSQMCRIVSILQQIVYCEEIVYIIIEMIIDGLREYPKHKSLLQGIEVRIVDVMK